MPSLFGEQPLTAASVEVSETGASADDIASALVPPPSDPVPGIAGRPHVPSDAQMPDAQSAPMRHWRAGVSLHAATAAAKATKDALASATTWTPRVLYGSTGDLTEGPAPRARVKEALVV
jgi:hypothetical protein